MQVRNQVLAKSSSNLNLLQDNFTKLADTCILIAGRSFDQGNWIRRGPKDVGGLIERSTTPIPKGESRTPVTLNSADVNTFEVQSDAALNEKSDGASIPTEDSQRSLSGLDLIDQVCIMRCSKFIPRLPSYLDKRVPWRETTPEPSSFPCRPGQSSCTVQQYGLLYRSTFDEDQEQVRRLNAAPHFPTNGPLEH